MTATAATPKAHVVIVGGGFGGLQTARRLRRANVRVTLLDRHNYHLFQPLLYQVATGGLSPANIATPLRSIVRRQKNCQVLMAEVTGFDAARKCLLLADGEIPYDVLVVAAGAASSYFGHDTWARFAPALKTIADAAEIRRRVYLAFEAAERERDPELRKALLTFVVVGGGPTGVELTGALAEIAHHTLKHDFRHMDPRDARILLVEAAPRILGHYPEKLTQHAATKLATLGVELLTGTMVSDISAEAVHLSSSAGETTIVTRTVLWGAGVQASPLAKRLAEAFGAERDRAGRVQVDACCRVGDHGDVFAIGDIATSNGADGKPLPGLAAVAAQQGAYVASLLARAFRERASEPPAAASGAPASERWLAQLRAVDTKPFVYRDRGSMATVGRASAVAEIGRRLYTGPIAWLLWLFVHLMLIVQFQNRLLILTQWAWNYFTFNRSNRLILGEEPLILARRERVDSNANATPANLG